MSDAAIPSTWESLRRLRRGSLFACGLMVLWFVLLTFLLYSTTAHAAGYVGQRRGFLQLLLTNKLLPVWLGFGVAHLHVGRKLLALSRQTHALADGAPLRPTGEAFSAFWKANLRAHLLLFAFVAIAWMIVSPR